MPKKWPWLLAGLIAAALFVGWLRPRTESSAEESSPDGAQSAHGKTSLASTKETDADRKEKNAALRAASPEARKRALMEAFAKTFNGEGSRDAKMSECWEILSELAKVADFHEMVALIDAHPEVSNERDSLMAAIFRASPLSVAELLTFAKDMSENDQAAAIQGLGDKIGRANDPKDYALLSELATSSGLVHCFNITLDMEMGRARPSGETQQDYFTKLAAVASTIPEERRATYEVMVAAVGRRTAPDLAWEAISGESPAGKSQDELRALTLERMIEKDPSSAMTSLMRGYPTADDDLVAGMTQWLAADPAAAKEWYAGLQLMQIIGPRGERLSKLVNSQ